jgi:enoyl-CoA hydratase/carnithine racemase
MTYQTLTFERKEGVGIVSLFDLDNHTKVSRLPDDLAELCSEIAWDEAIRVVVLTGAGEKSFLTETTPMEERESIACSIAEPIAKLNRPVIAALNGDAMGQRLELALACDIRIATEGSHFGLSHIQSGFIPWDGGTQRLPRLVGKGKAMEMILTGEAIDAREAYRIGLVNKVVPLDQLMATAMTMAQEIAAKGPIALRYAKEAIYKGMDLTLEQGLRLEADLYLLLHTTKDRTEGIKAFREKKAPKFEGR